MCKDIYNENKISFVMTLNKLEEHLVAPRMAFAQIYQYGLQSSIVNVPTNVDKMQITLLQLVTCESTIMGCIERKLEYKSPYFLGYVQPKVVMKALHDFCNTPIYKEAKVISKKDCANS
jgi:hypothetical protein